MSLFFFKLFRLAIDSYLNVDGGSLSKRARNKRFIACITKKGLSLCCLILGGCVKCTFLSWKLGSVGATWGHIGSRLGDMTTLIHASSIEYIGRRYLESIIENGGHGSVY